MIGKKTKFCGVETNENRAAAGSKNGLAGRAYPIEIAKRLNKDFLFVKEVCNLIGKNPDDFSAALAGSDIPAYGQQINDRTKKVKTKANLRIAWKNGLYSDFRVKHESPSQIHLELTENFIEKYEARYGQCIPEKVKEALLLFTGRHGNQKQILDSISVNYVGDDVRDLERKYNDRLTLASMHGYDENMVSSLLQWFKEQAANLFIFCFAHGAVEDSKCDGYYLWYHQEMCLGSDYKIYDLRELHRKLQHIDKEYIVKKIGANDSEQVGSTIALPFGNLQYHLHSLQFRHDPKKILDLHNYVLKQSKKSTFGSQPKISGHENEVRIAEELNKKSKFCAHFCERVGRDLSDFSRAQADGIHAKREDSILGGKTTGKTDLVVFWKNGEQTNVSIKKRTAGQVYLVTAKNFINVFESQYHKIIPSKVRRALEFFIGENGESRAILEATPVSVDGEKARKIAEESNYRLMFSVIENYDPEMAKEFLSFLKKEMEDIFELCFSAGAVKDRNLWSDVLWYKNLVDMEGVALDYLIPIPLIKASISRLRDELVVCPGANAGSTISLPFGHLQYHLKQLEFYQKLSKIQNLISSH